MIQSHSESTNILYPGWDICLMTHHGNFTKTQRTNVWFSPQKHHLHLIQQCRKSTPSPVYLGMGEPSHVCECKEIFASSRWQAYLYTFLFTNLRLSLQWQLTQQHRSCWEWNKIYGTTKNHPNKKVSFLSWFLGCPSLQKQRHQTLPCICKILTTCRTPHPKVI